MENKPGQSTGPGLRVAGLAWMLVPLFFGGGYITLAVYWLLPVLGLVGAVLSGIDLVKGRKWALLGLVLSLAPFLLILGAIGMMVSGSR
jgi:hypothetical protein